MRAACHIHSNWSYDGSWSIPDLASAFASRGYQLLLMTEHDRGFDSIKYGEFRSACADASTPELLVVPGIEYSDSDNTIHVLVWGDIPFLGVEQPTLKLLQSVREANGFSVLAHPSRRGAWKLFDPRWVPLLGGIELWNRKTDGWTPSSPARALIQAHSASAFVGLDFHSRKQFFPLAMSFDLNETLSEASVLSSLLNNRLTPVAFGTPATQFSRSWYFPLLQSAELCRRTAGKGLKLARAVNLLRRRVGQPS